MYIYTRYCIAMDQSELKRCEIQKPISRIICGSILDNVWFTFSFSLIHISVECMYDGVLLTFRYDAGPLGDGWEWGKKRILASDEYSKWNWNRLGEAATSLSQFAVFVLCYFGSAHAIPPVLALLMSAQLHNEFNSDDDLFAAAEEDGGWWR